MATASAQAATPRIATDPSIQFDDISLWRPMPRKSERTHRHDSPERGMLLGLAAAALFGVSTPLSKLLLSTTAPLMLAALLYLGAGVALTAGRAISGDSREARVARADLPWLAAIIVAGGRVGPILLLICLVRLSGVAGSVLLYL